MGTVSFEVPGPGTYQVTCDPKLDTLANSGTAEDVLAGKQFYNDQNAPVTGTMPNNPPGRLLQYHCWPACPIWGRMSPDMCRAPGPQNSQFP